MKRNEGTADRILRALAAVAAVATAAAVGGGTALGVTLLVVAVVLGVTAATGFCPLYRLLGLSTLRSSKTEAHREPVRAS